MPNKDKTNQEKLKKNNKNNKKKQNIDQKLD
jgi:hypothetical protein